jgi:glycosyltransferase involved in cell wall biosynthesis
MKFGVVAIGRNEGERLRQCLASLPAAGAAVYVDSGSSDGSVQSARDLNVPVVELDMRLPFTAARARNAGFRRLRETFSEVEFVQFMDGDCTLVDGWLESAVSFLKAHADVGALCGRRRERYPELSVYNWLCEREWDRPVGQVRHFGGDVMIRVSALEAVGGYRDDLIAGEDPELSVRLRKAGWHIWRLDREMTQHDAAMTRFGQWWRRTLRGGYAYAQGAYVHGASPERHFIRESRRAWVWGIWLPPACLLCGLLIRPWGWATLLIYPLQILRQTIRNRGSLHDRVLLALFQLLARFPEGLGQIKFMRDRMLGHRARLIEYRQ